MKRFRFPQESLLRLKRQLRRQAEIKLWQAAYLVQQTESDLEKLLGELSCLSAIPAKGPSGQAVWRWHLGASALQAEIKRTQQTLAERKQAHEVVQQEFQRVDAEYEALSLLRTNKWREHRSKASAAQQVILDETAMRRWLTRRADDGEMDVDD